MRTVQVVVDEPLLRRVDHRARKMKTSRSAYIRASLERALEIDAIASLVEEDRRAHQKRPETKDEADARRLLDRAQARVMRALLDDEEGW